MRRLMSFAGLAAFIAALFASLPNAQEKAPAGSQTVAIVNGKPITGEELNKVAGPELEKLELEKLQFEANYARNRQQALERGLARLIEGRLLAAEAAKRGISEKELLAREVDAKVRPPSPEEVNSFYESNKARINQPKEQVGAQIQQYLQQQATANARSGFIQRLKKEYEVASFLGPVRNKVESEGHPSRGPASARVTIVEFSDFQCPYCRTMAATLKEVEKNHPKDVRLVFRQFPLTGLHPNAQKAGEASLCGQEQGRFWELHDAMFEDQASLNESDLKAKAAKLKLDPAAFNACLDSGKYANKVRQDMRDGAVAGVSGTPALFINGRFLSGAQPYREIAKIIEEELNQRRDVR